MKEQHLVSIIVPVYNTERYLARCIDSILAQTYSNIQLILVDDGSTDHSGVICDERAEKDSRVVVLHQKNGGVSAARNAGIDLATGKYLMFVDSDDALLKSAVELLLDDMVTYNADIVSAVKSVVDSYGNEHCDYDDKKIAIYDGLTPLKMSLEYERQTNSVCAKLFDRIFFSSIRFIPERTINEDGYFLFQCYALCPKLVQHNVAIYQYHIHENSSSRTGFSDKYFDMIYFAEEKMKYIQEHHPELWSLALNMKISTHLFFLEVLCRTSNKKYKYWEQESILLVRKNYRTYYSKNKHERQIAAIVYYGLFPLYKIIVRLKYRY